MGVTKKKQGGHNYPGAESLWGNQITAGAPKSTNNVTSTFFNTVLLLAIHKYFLQYSTFACNAVLLLVEKLKA